MHVIDKGFTLCKIGQYDYAIVCFNEAITCYNKALKLTPEYYEE